MNLFAWQGWKWEEGWGILLEVILIAFLHVSTKVKYGLFQS